MSEFHVNVIRHRNCAKCWRWACVKVTTPVRSWYCLPCWYRIARATIFAVTTVSCTYPPAGPSAYTCDDQRHQADSLINAGRVDLPVIVDLPSGERVLIGDHPWHPISHVSGPVPVDANPSTLHCVENQ